MQSPPLGEETHQVEQGQGVVYLPNNLEQPKPGRKAGDAPSTTRARSTITTRRFNPFKTPLCVEVEQTDNMQRRCPETDMSASARVSVPSSHSQRLLEQKQFVETNGHAWQRWGSMSSRLGQAGRGGPREAVVACPEV